MISSFIPMLLLLVLLLELAALLLLLAFDAFDELGDDVVALLGAALELVALLLLLLELLLLPPELAEEPEDCFSFLSLIIIYTNVDSSDFQEILNISISLLLITAFVRVYLSHIIEDFEATGISQTVFIFILLNH